MNRTRERKPPAGSNKKFQARRLVPKKEGKEGQGDDVWYYDWTQFCLAIVTQIVRLLCALTRGETMAQRREAEWSARKHVFVLPGTLRCRSELVGP